jgi:protein arginine kinase activator
MICEFCKKNKANVNIIKIVNGKTEKINICIDCLKSFTLMPADEFFNDLNNVLKKFLEVDIKISDKGEIDKILGTVNSYENKTCSFCLCDLNTIKAIGQAGCPQCYIEFRNSFIQILKTIHGSYQHKGKIPLKTGSKVKIQKEINDLEHRLREEITVENFEEAAKLRDTIKKLRKKLFAGRKTN